MNEFNTNKNKEMLWNILLKGGKFNNLPGTFNPQQIFEKHISQIEIKSDMNAPLVHLNKSFLSSLLGEITTYTTSPNLVKQKKQDAFNNSLKQREENFNDSMQIKVPPQVDFSDKNEDAPIGDIEKLIEEQRSKRNLDIPKIPQTDERSVQDWLNGTNNNAPINNMNSGGEFNSNKHIKIGNTINSMPDDNVIINLNSKNNKPAEKTVKWQDGGGGVPPLPNINDMLSDVQEARPVNTKSIEAALIKILKNQDYIINAIHDLQDRI